MASSRDHRFGIRPALARRCEQSGQIFALLVVVIVALLALASFVVDLGHAFYVKRALQAQVDAAATAAAQELPNAAAVLATVDEYSGSAGGKNEQGNIPDVTTTATTKCLSIARCDPINAVTVEGTATVNTFFGKIIGIDSFDITATATACSPCAASPGDIMLVLDRTGSMCEDSNGNPDPACTDLNNAKEGMRTFLSFLEPEHHWVGLGVFPPGPSCSEPATSAYHDPSSPYILVPLSQDYKTGNSLNSSSALVSTIDCQQAGGRTAYANAIEAAQAAIDAQGRPEVPDIIVVVSDGAANIGPDYYATNSSYRMQPCNQGVWSASAIKGGDTEIYSIGYDLNALGGNANVCRAWNFTLEVPGITAYQALQQMSSGPDYFFNQPGPGELNTIFTAIAEKVTGIRLIDESVT